MIRLYFDEDSMDHDLIVALRAPGVDVATALEKGMIARSDAEHLDCATRDGRVLFSFNRGDFYELHVQYLSKGKSHAGMILASQQRYSVGETMRRILLLANTKSHEDMKNWVEFLNAWA